MMERYEVLDINQDIEHSRSWSYVGVHYSLQTVCEPL